MLPALIAISTISAAILLWLLSTRRRIVVLEDKIDNAMSQIGVQFSSYFDALTKLLEVTGCYAKNESERLVEVIQSRRISIIAKSTLDELMCQEDIILEILGKIDRIVKRNPELKKDDTYNQTMHTVQTFSNMVCTSYLIYNDSVSKLNREMQRFPVSLLAGILGFQKRDYIEEKAVNEK